jgi:hypothetical protein
MLVWVKKEISNSQYCSFARPRWIARVGVVGVVEVRLGEGEAGAECRVWRLRERGP